MRKIVVHALLITLTFTISIQAFCQSKLIESQVVERTFVSKILEKNKLDIDTKRKLKIYLPDNYQKNKGSYPVVYFFHGANWDNDRAFEDGNVKKIIDRAIKNQVIEPFIFVMPDFRTQHMGSFFQNNEVSGRWLDYMLSEVVPYIDDNFRTIRTANARGVTGDYWGGYAALKFAMLYPETFSSSYAMHPVATGPGKIPLVRRIDWEHVFNSKNYDDLQENGFSRFIVALSQAYLPNPNNPPFFNNHIVAKSQEGFMVDVENMHAFQENMSLMNFVPKYVENLRKLKAIALDWGRYDLIHDHIEGNESFSRQLDTYGIDHYAEGYRGGPFDTNWTDDGRVYTRVLPFFSRHLHFKKK